MSDLYHLDRPAFVVAATAITVDGRMFPSAVSAIKVEECNGSVAGERVPFTMPSRSDTSANAAPGALLARLLQIQRAHVNPIHFVLKDSYRGRPRWWWRRSVRHDCCDCCTHGVQQDQLWGNSD